MVQTRKVIPNQVFVGCPWNGVLPKYEDAIARLKLRYPIYFKIVGRDGRLQAVALLNEIRKSIDSSSWAIFDVTNGNPNVSLECGYADARGVPQVINACTHKASLIDRERPIIEDIKGYKRNDYKRTDEIHDLLEAFSVDHEYTRRFDEFYRKNFRRAEKKEKRRMGLRLLNLFDSRPHVFQRDIVGGLHAHEYSVGEIDDLIRRMRKAGLLRQSGKRGFKLA